ncbi:MAG: hypothetical protein MZW92_21985 [Comamonadaceae bacterium]|nr:hypothetical protein [Comamonadaceae bacterium]
MRSCIALVAALWATAGAAGVEPAPATEPAPPAASRAAADVGHPGHHASALTCPRKATGRHPATKSRTLRCWQYGRLIFEEAVTSLPPSLAGRGQVFDGKSGKQPLQLLDIHTATCLVK